MINEESLNKMYEEVIHQGELTTKKLNSYGFNSRDLANLIQIGSLERIKRGIYQYLSAADLYAYGEQLSSRGEHYKAKLCFEKCYDLEPKNYQVCLQIFRISLEERNYDLAFTCLDTLINTENPYHFQDYNLYLYLLSMVTNIPERYREYAKHLKFENILILEGDERYADIPNQNKIRKLVHLHKFAYALSQLNTLINNQEALTIQNRITRSLIYQAAENEAVSKNTLLALATAKKYTEIITYLQQKKQNHYLSVFDESIDKIARELLNIQKNRQIPKMQIFTAKTVHEAIAGGNYKLALQLSQNYNDKKKIDNTTNIINILLTDICNLIYSTASISQNKSLVPSKNEEGIQQKVEEEEKYAKELDAKLEEIFQIIQRKMSVNNQKEYVFLVMNLIKVSLMENDSTFSKALTVLEEINNNVFTYDISVYIQAFYQALTQNELAKAKIYLDIIKEASALGQTCVLTPCLESILKKTEQLEEQSRENLTNKTMKVDVKLVTSIKVTVSVTKEGNNEAQELPNLASDYRNSLELINNLRNVINKKINPTIPSQIQYCYEAFDSLNEYALKAGVDIDAACADLNMTKEQTDIIKLICAKRYYQQGDYEKGDQFLKSVEKSQNKTKETIQWLNKIRKNKKFYINRAATPSKKLALTLQPKK